MSDEKFVDPRLQAKEGIFQQLHLSTFDNGLCPCDYSRSKRQWQGY
jgi:hypothetical protein